MRDWRQSGQSWGSDRNSVNPMWEKILSASCVSGSYCYCRNARKIIREHIPRLCYFSSLQKWLCHFQLAALRLPFMEHQRKKPFLKDPSCLSLLNTLAILLCSNLSVSNRTTKYSQVQHEEGNMSMQTNSGLQIMRTIYPSALSSFSLAARKPRTRFALQMR